jgi:dimethyl sulfoxide reductase iron-sulfur subunit
MARYGMVIDLEACLGCSACSLACKVEYGTPKGIFWHRVVQKEIGKWPNANRQFLPMLCMQCQDASCVQVCPTGASSRDLETGIVNMDYDKCMGCRYCEIACPYDARSFIEHKDIYFPEYGPTPYEEIMYKKHQEGVVEKCNFCLDRVKKGEKPVCVATCPAYARHFGDLDDPNSEVSNLITKRHGYQLMAELGTNPSVYYLPG